MYKKSWKKQKHDADQKIGVHSIYVVYKLYHKNVIAQGTSNNLQSSKICVWTDTSIRANFNVTKSKEIIIHIRISVAHMEENTFKINWIEFSFKRNNYIFKLLVQISLKVKYHFRKKTPAILFCVWFISYSCSLRHVFFVPLYEKSL